VAKDTYGRYLFLAGAAWNWMAAAGAVLIASQAETRSRLGLDSGAGLLSLHLGALCVALFGLGYYWVSRDPAANRGLVALGAVGKPLVFLLCLGHALTGRISLAWVAPTLGDLVLGLLFLEFMRTRPLRQT
jgi:hypothetical protein